MKNGDFVVYLAGPMSGYEDYNFPAFNAAAEKLRSMGFVVINPAETAGGCATLPRASYFRYDFSVINALCDAIVVLPGWDQSQGAQAESIITTEIGLPIYLYDEEKGLGGRVIIKEWAISWEVQQ